MIRIYKAIMVCVAVFLICISSSLAVTGLTIDQVDGAIDSGSIATGTPITFHIRMTNDGVNVKGVTNGFRIYSPTGATWDTTSASLTGAITTGMMEQFFINEFSTDGTGSDTVGFGGFSLFAPGIPTGFDTIPYTLTIGPIDPIFNGRKICLDSTFYPPAGSWLWSTVSGGMVPSWDGPHCYTVIDTAAGATGGSLSLDHVSGLAGLDTLATGVPITFHIRMTNQTGNAITGLTNGFRVYSPTGSQWNNTSADTTGAITPSMMENIFINEFSVDGMGADTVGFGGFRLFTSGILDGFDTVAYQIKIGPIDPAYGGGQICIDTSYYPPAGIWKWSTTGGDYFPSWDGIHCFDIEGTSVVPRIVSVNPNNADQGQSLWVTITGENTKFGMGSGTTVRLTDQFGLSEIWAGSVNVFSKTFMNAHFTINDSAMVGPYSLTVFTTGQDSVSLSPAFWVNPAPMLVSVIPDTAHQGQTLDVQITGRGTRFFQASMVTVRLADSMHVSIPASSVAVIHNELLTARFNIPNSASPGYRDVTVNQGIYGQVTKYGAFHILPLLGADITLDKVDGLAGPGVLAVNQPIRFYMRLRNNTGKNIQGSTNGFRLYSNNGASWDSTSGQWTGAVTNGMYDQIFVNPFSADGMLADTIGFGGFRIFTTGIPNGFDDTAWTIDIGPIPLSEVGKQICIDSTFYPPTSGWLWSLAPAKADYIPTWGGPYCFDIDSLSSNTPQIAVSPDSFFVSQVPDNSTLRTLTIANRGGGALNYQLNIVFAQPLDGSVNSVLDVAPEVVKAQKEAQSQTGAVNSLTVWEANGVDEAVYQPRHNTGGVSRSSVNGPVRKTSMMIEDFERSQIWPWAPWTPIDSVPEMVISGCAHDGSSGIMTPSSGPTWFYRTDITVGMPGTKLSMWVRPDLIAGRAYLGFGATSNGAWSLVAAPNTNSLIIQENSSYGFINLISVPQSYLLGNWYKLEVVFGDSGFVTGNLYGADGMTLLKSVSAMIPVLPQAGVAFRGFGHCMDTFESVNGMSGWLRADRNSGSVPGGSADAVMLTFDATNLNPGEYLAMINVNSNDPANQTVMVSARMLVTGGGTTDLSLIQVDGLTMAGKLPYGQPITFHIGLHNTTGENIVGSTNGFRVYSPTGARWTTTTGTSTGAIDSSIYDQGVFINPFSNNGMGADTIGFGGFRIFGSGIPVGFNEDVWTINIGPIPQSYAGGSICLDSAFYRPAGIWKWSLGPAKTGHFPTWDGPHCFQIEDSSLTCSLSVTPAQLSFTAIAGGSNPPCKSIFINSPCVTAMNYDTTWISVVPGEVGEIVCVDATGLLPGRYRDSINIWVAGDPSLRTAVVVDLNIRSDSSCTLQYFTDFMETGLLYPYVIASLPECNLMSGDEIGLFDVEQGLLVGAMPYCGESFPLSINAWQGDSLRGLPGYIPGHNLEVQIYKSGIDEVLCTEISGSCLRFNECGFGIIDSLSCRPCFTEFCTPFPIEANRWRTISLPLSPIVSASMDDITCDIAQVFSTLNQLDILKDDHGGVYIPSFGINTMDCIDPGEGYDLFKYGGDQQLCVLGSQVPSFAAVIKANKWNIIGYPLVCPMPIDFVMQGIVNTIDIVKDDNGGVFIPSFEINTIGEMIPGKGYKVFLNTRFDAMLTYPTCFEPFNTPSNGSVPFSKPADDRVRHFEFAVTGLSYPIILTDIGDLLAVGDEIAVFDGDLCVGAIRYQHEKKLVLNAWKSDPEHNLPGYTLGQKLDVRLKPVDGSERSLLTYQTKTAKFDDGPYQVINLAKATALPKEYALSQNYPNPFNPSTVVQFALPEAAHVTLEVYNMLGRKVITLLDDDYQAGNHEITWAGKDSYGREVSTGVYFYRLSANDFTKTKKMMLVK